MADEVESVADYCQSLANYRTRLDERHEAFTTEAKADLSSLLDETRALFMDAAGRIGSDADKIEIEDLIERAERQRKHADAIREGHLERIKGGNCDALAGLTFSDMVVALRRIKNHTINLVEARNSTWESRLEALQVLDVVRRNTLEPRPSS
jgi:phosphate:Na+ symporter